MPNYNLCFFTFLHHDLSFYNKGIIKCHNQHNTMYLLSFFTKIFHFLPGELSHHLALKSLKILYSLGLLKILMRINFKKEDNNFVITPTKALNCKNKLGIAAGLDKDGEYIDCLSALGVGFIEVGTVTPIKQQGNPRPRLFRNKKDQSLLNRLGFNNNGVEALVENLKNRKSKIPIGVSIGKNFDTPNSQAFKDYLFCMEKVYAYSNYIAINISSPNTSDLRELSSEEYLEDLLSKIKSKQIELSKSLQYVPIFLKVSPDECREDLKKICHAIIKNEIDGIICSNTTTNHKDKNGHGGLSGSPLKEISTKNLLLVKEIVGTKIPVIASGGVMSVSDYNERIEAGADFVQIYTGFIFEGPRLIYDILIEGIS